MNYSIVISYLYPTAVVEVDFSVLLNGTEWSITKWNTAKLGPQPTPAQLETAWPAAQLQAAQTRQRAIIKSSFTAAANANVTDASGIVWEGGTASGNSIFLACQLAQQMGTTSLTLYDAAKNAHSMTIAEGMSVAALIGQAYQVALGTKNSLYAQINAATTVSTVQSIIW